MRNNRNHSLPCTTGVLDAFLTQHELRCFISDDSLIKMIDGRNDRGITHCIILCVPTSQELSEQFAKQLSEFFLSTALPVTILWAWQLNVEQSVAVRIIFNLKESRKQLFYQADILWPMEARFEITPISGFIQRLQQQLREYHLICTLPPAAYEYAHGDVRLQVAFRLLSHLMQIDPELRQQFLQLTRSNAVKETLNALLNVVPCLNTPLFYAEHTANIMEMTPHIMGHDWQFHDIKPILKNIARVGVLSYLLYEQNPATLLTLPLMLSMQWIMPQLMSKVPSPLFQIVLHYFCQASITAVSMAFMLYNALPGTSAQQDILAPRYLLQWGQLMQQEIIMLLAQMVLMALCFYCIDKTLPQRVIQDPHYQPGIQSIATLSARYALSLVRPLFSSELKEILTQLLEERLLLSIDSDCQREPRCQLSIGQSSFVRLLQQLTRLESTTDLTVKSSTKQADCTLVSSVNQTCVDSRLACRYSFFPDNPNRTTSALTLKSTPEYKAYFMQQCLT